ncbi:MAG: hypothetical protein K0R55_1065 [Sporomusa sp.]|nr:hypothetical protein [Sporomusa sp.]
MSELKINEIATNELKRIENRKKIMCLGLAVLLGIITLLIAPITGLPLGGQRSLAILVFIVVTWATEAVPYPVSALMLIVLMTWAGAADPKVSLKASFTKSLAGFAGTVPAGVLAATAFAAVVKSSGLSERIIYKIMAVFAGKEGAAKVDRILSAMFIAEVPLSFLAPTATGRTALYVSFAEGLVKPFNFTKELISPKINPFQKAVYMAAGMMPSTMGAAFLTGAEATLLAGRLIEEGTHSPQYWINTAEYLLVPALIMLAFQWVTLKKMFPSSQETVSMDFVHEQLDKLGAMKYEEKYVLVTLIAAVGLWVTDKIHHIPAEVVLIIVAIVLFLPGFGPGNWKQDSKSIAWGSIMVIAAATSFASLLTSTGVIKMIADWVGGLGITSFVEVMLLVGVITLILRLGVASVTASAALFIPLAIMVGSNAGFSQGQLVALGWITYVFCRAGYFLPSQTASLMMTFDYGYFGQNDLIKVGIKLTLATVLVYGLWASFVIPALVK